MKSKKEYLKLCPFCGSAKVKVTPKSEYKKQLKEQGAAFLNITCPYCEMVKPKLSGSDDYEQVRAEAVAQWNIRSGF